VLIVDFHALEPIHLLHFVHQMFLQILRSAHLEDFVRNNRAFRKLLAFLHKIAFEDNDVFGERDQVLFLGSGIRIL